jgi:hypothetical protein
MLYDENPPLCPNSLVGYATFLGLANGVFRKEKVQEAKPFGSAPFSHLSIAAPQFH